MALNKYERYALIEARKLIAARNHFHLCYALGTVGDTNNEPVTTACRRLREFVMAQIAPYGTLNKWAQKHSRISLHWDGRYQARIDWIDWMLNEPKEA